MSADINRGNTTLGTGLRKMKQFKPKSITTISTLTDTKSRLKYTKYGNIYF